MLPDLKRSEVWFVTGSQHLYGPQTLERVALHSQEVAAALDQSRHLPCRVVFEPVVKTPDEIQALLAEANVAQGCVGLVPWMHTFSPAESTSIRELKKELRWNEASYPAAKGL